MKRLSDSQVALKSGYPEYFICVFPTNMLTESVRRSIFLCSYCGVPFSTINWNTPRFKCICHSCLSRVKSKRTSKAMINYWINYRSRS